MSDKKPFPEASRRWLTWEYFAAATDIDSENRDAFIELLNDRSKFHIWLTSLITGSVVALTAFGVKPGTASVGGILAMVSLGLLILAILTNLVCVWSIPSLKFEVSSGTVYRGALMRWDLGVSAWVGVFSFVLGLLLAAIATVLT